MRLLLAITLAISTTTNTTTLNLKLNFEWTRSLTGPSDLQVSLSLPARRVHPSGSPRASLSLSFSLSESAFTTTSNTETPNLAVASIAHSLAVSASSLAEALRMRRLRVDLGRDSCYSVEALIHQDCRAVNEVAEEKDIQFRQPLAVAPVDLAGVLRELLLGRSARRRTCTHEPPLCQHSQGPRTNSGNVASASTRNFERHIVVDLRVFNIQQVGHGTRILCI